MRTLVAAVLFVGAAVACDNVTLASGRYEEILAITIALSCTGIIVSAIAAWRIQGTWYRVAFVLLGLVGAAVLVDALGRLL